MNTQKNKNSAEDRFKDDLAVREVQIYYLEKELAVRNHEIDHLDSVNYFLVAQTIQSRKNEELLIKKVEQLEKDKSRYRRLYVKELQENISLQHKMKAKPSPTGSLPNVVEMLERLGLTNPPSSGISTEMSSLSPEPEVETTPVSSAPTFQLADLNEFPPL